jgi:hypothetical protein
VWAPLAVGVGALAATIVLHGLAISTSVTLVRRIGALRRTGAGFWTNLTIVALVILLAGVAHLLEISVWAVLFMICGEFATFTAACYHSAVNYTTLGYGDVIMTPRWRMLGPLEAANGMLMFGVTTALVFAVIQQLVNTRFASVRDSAPC